MPRWFSPVAAGASRLEDLSHPSLKTLWLHLLAVSLWVDFWIALAVKCVVSPRRHTVYPLFEAAALRWWNDQPLYTASEGLDFYRYSPTFAASFAPLAWLPTWLGSIVWVTLSLGLLFWSTRLLVRHVLPEGFAARHEPLLLALTLVVSIRGIWALQSNSLVFALVALGAVAIARQRWWSAAFLLAVPVYIKLWPLAAVLLLVACWPRQLIARFAVATALLAAIPLLAKPPHMVLGHYVDWYEALFGPFQFRWPGFRDAWTMWELVQQPVNRGAYLAAQLAAAACALALCLWQRARGLCTRGVLTTVLCSWTCWQLAFGPGTERNTYGLIAPLVSWGLITAFTERKGRMTATLAFGLVTVFSFGIFERALLPVLPAAGVALPLGVLLFAFWSTRCTLGWTNGAWFDERTQQAVSIKRTPLGARKDCEVVHESRRLGRSPGCLSLGGEPDWR